jgi:hypothetical protein
VLHGNALSQYNAGTSTYTAAFDQEVNIIMQLQLNMRNNGIGFLEIRNGATVLRSSNLDNRDNDAGASSTNISNQREIGVKARLTSGDEIRFYAQINPASGSFNVTQNPTFGCHIQFEVVRDLS